MKDLILKKIGELRKAFRKQGLNSEASILLLLLKFAGYDDEWRSKVNQLAAGNPRPFKDWFGGEDRVYLPFGEAAVVVDPKVEEALGSIGFKITDYIRGYAEKDGRKLKIGKVIGRAKKSAIKHIDRLIQESTGIEGADERIRELEAHKASLITYWDSVAATFRDSPYRTHKEHRGNLMIIMSQNPHDLAQMSYERSWTSCMNLGEGAYYRDLLCEVEGGGFVAYLVNQDDTEIKKPLARIHIRRFDGEGGRIIAVPEDSAYGDDVEGFYKTVKMWVDSRNKDYPVGRYSLRGGTYSDTFSNKSFISAPENEEKLLEWFKGDLPNPTSVKWVAVDEKYHDLSEHGYWQEDNPFWHHEDEDGEKVFDTEVEAMMFIDSLKDYDPTDSWIDLLYGHETQIDEDDFLTRPDSYEDSITERAYEERFSVKRNDIDHTVDMKDEAVKKIIKIDRDRIRKGEGKAYSPEAYREMANFLNKQRSFWDDSKKAFYSTYPEMLSTVEFLQSPYMFQEEILKDMMGKVSDEHEKRLRGALKAKIIKQFDLSNKNLKIGSARAGYENTSSDVRYAISAMAMSLRGMDYIDDELFEHINDFIFHKIFEIGIKEEDVGPAMTASISALSPQRMSKENLKKLIRSSIPFYDEVSWEYDDEISIHTMGFHMRSLGEDGKEFLRFLRRQLDSIDHNFKPREENMWDPNRSKREIAIMKSRVVNVINTITTGKPPNKGWNITHDEFISGSFLTKDDLIQ